VPRSPEEGIHTVQIAPMQVLLISALLGGVLAATLVWLWLDDWVFALLLAPFGGSLATLLAATFLVAAEFSSVRTFLASQRQRWRERKARRNARTARPLDDR
jgi:hypothetical protein